MLRLETARIVHDDFVLDADLAFDTGHIVAIVGPSGSGKTTLLSGIAGFVPLASGRITWNGRDLGNLDARDRPVSMIFQEHNLFPHLNVARNVGLGIDPSLRLGKADQAKVDEALDQVGLSGLSDRLPAQLSGGQRGRVALARVLVMDRPILLLDEPFSALGPALRVEMLNLVASLSRRKGLTVLMVTHIPEDAKLIADETVFISDRTVQPPVTTEDLFANPPAALRSYLGD